jgi:hypothetical protein
VCACVFYTHDWRVLSTKIDPPPKKVQEHTRNETPTHELSMLGCEGGVCVMSCNGGQLWGLIGNGGTSYN